MTVAQPEAPRGPVRLSVYLSPAEAERVRAHARSNYRTVCGELRQALRAYFEALDDADHERPIAASVS